MGLDEELEVMEDGELTEAEQVDEEAAIEQVEGDQEEEEELYEIVVDDDDIAYYIEDEDGNEIGFAIVEDGEEVEYYYVDDEGECECGCGGKHTAVGEDNEYDLGITREGVAEATDNMNAIYKDGIVMAAEFKGAFDDIKSALDFSDLIKKPGK